MKILLVTSSFPRWPGDWAGVFVESLGRRLSLRGHRVTVLCPHAAGLPTREDACGLTIERFRYAWPACAQTLAYGQGMLTNVRANPLRLLLLAPYTLVLGMRMRALRKVHDVVNVHFLIPQAMVARLFGVRSVASLHGTDVNLALGGLGRRLARFGLSRSAAVTANSEATAERTAGLVPGGKPRVIPMGVDTAEFSPAGTAARGFGDGKLKLITVGRLIPLKGHRFLIDALALIRRRLGEAELTIVGDGPEREALTRQSEMLGLGGAVRFEGEVRHFRIGELLREHDVFILPSIVLPSGEAEGLGTVVLEAMAVGIPVIGSDVGGIPDIIRDGQNGLLVPEREPEAIARAVARVADDGRLRRRLTGTARREVKERFSWDVIAGQFEQLFIEVKSS